MLNSYRKNDLKSIKGILVRPTKLIEGHQRQALEQGLSKSDSLGTVYQFRLRLQAIWTAHSSTHDGALEALQEWCNLAESSGIQAVENFSEGLRKYSVAY